MKKIAVLFSLLFTLFVKAQMPPGGAGNKDMMKVMKDIKGRVYGKMIDQL